jgi:hypothetical protein
MMDKELKTLIQEEYVCRQNKKNKMLSLQELIVEEHTPNRILVSKTQEGCNAYDMHGLPIDYPHNLSDNNYKIILQDDKLIDILSYKDESLTTLPYIERKTILKHFTNHPIQEYTLTNLNNAIHLTQILMGQNKTVSLTGAHSSYAYGKNKEYILVVPPIQHEQEELTQNTPSTVFSELKKIINTWTPYTIQHHYIGDKQQHTDLRIKTKDGLIGYTIFTPGNNTSLDKFSTTSKLIMGGEWKEGKASEEWLDKNEYIPEKEWVILTVDQGQARVHKIENDKVIIQFNGGRKQIDKTPLKKAGIKDNSPTHYKNLNGFWVIISTEDTNLIRKVKEDKIEEMMKEWVETLSQRALIPNAQERIWKIYQHYSQNKITYAQSLSRKLELSPKTLHTYRDKLGYMP